MSAVLCAVFFLSGASALIFETLWFRQAGLAFGNSVWASSLVLSGFMGGLALGNALAGRYGRRLGQPLRIYAIAETTIALTGVGLVYLFPILGALLAPWLRPLLDHAWILNPLRLLIAFLLLLIPSTAMGLTLPLLVTTLTAYDRNFGRVLGRLYGWNTLGAVAGVVIGETYLVGVYGVRGTAVIAGALNVLGAAVAAWLSVRGTEAGGASAHASMPARESRPHPALTAGTRWLVAGFTSGFCLLALELVWFRFLVLFVKGHSTAFPLMLAIVLAAIGCGELVAATWLRRVPDAHRFAAMVAFGAGVLCVASYAVFPETIAPFGLSTITKPLAILEVSAPLMFPVSFLSGMFFTLLGAALRGHLTSETETAGVLTLANTTGAALGSLTGGFVLLPLLGIERSFFLIAILYAAVGVMLWRSVKGRLPSAATGRMTLASAGVCLAALVFFPFGSLEARLLPIPVTRWADAEAESRLVAVREGLTETVIYFERLFAGAPVSDVMLTNSFSMSTTGYGVRRYQKLYVYWPMAVHPDLRRALLIGYGVGNTAKAMTDSRSLEAIDVVDLSRDILAMNRIVYPDENDLPLHDPRVRVHIEDGRYFLQTTDRLFDLITGEPPPPGIAGVENLYTREYFQLLRARLAEGGIATYWLPLADLTDVSAKAILRAFCDAFEDCSLWNGSGTNLMMVGSRNAIGPGPSAVNGPVSEEQFTRQWKTPAVAAEMERLGVEQPEQLGALFIGDNAYLRRLVGASGALTDNYPKVIDAPASSPAETDVLYASVTNTAAARQRFRDSPLIARLWPRRLLTSSLGYFDFQQVIDSHYYGNLVKPTLAIDDVHRVLTGSSLSAPVLWRLASNSDIQQAVSKATPEELANPLLQLHLGIRYISERNYAAAVEALKRAEQLPEISSNAFVLHIYALCMAGRTAEAQQLASEAFAASGATSLPPLWMWMKGTFGIDLKVEKLKSGKVEK